MAGSVSTVSPTAEAGGSERQAAVPAQAFESLAVLQQLSLEAGLSESRKQLIFRILNRTVSYCRYDRAALWRLDGQRPRLLGVSGGMDVGQHTPLAHEWRGLIRRLEQPERAAILGPHSYKADEARWAELAARTRGLSVVWLPIHADGRVVAGLWLERWGTGRFVEAEKTRLEALALAYGVAWRSVAGRPTRLGRRLASRKGAWAACVLLALTAVLWLVPVPLRIVAHCEVVPRDPVAVTAPLNGVIDEVLVLPGREVREGDLLAVYDKRVAQEELKVAEQQVEIVRSDLQRARAQAFDEPRSRSEIALLENRLEQEETRLRLARYRASRLEIRAPASGTVMLDDPAAWRGRPVQVGERILMVVDPARTKVRIWLPEHDNVEFVDHRPLKVLLDADPRRERAAHLRFLANHSQPNRDGIPCFRAEADWAAEARPAKLGLQGSAVLYGEDVSLGYWLLRRPLAAVRRFFGI